MEVLWALLRCLTGTLDRPPPADAWTQVERLPSLPAGASCFEFSLALIDLPDICSLRPFDSAFYVNNALDEIMTQPQDNDPIEGNPARIAQVLWAQGEVSRVPWIFNAMLNEVESREEVVEPEKFPPEIHLSVTGACNIQCLFCIYSHKEAKREAVGRDMAAPPAAV